MNATTSRILGFGHYAPDQIITNAEIENRMGLSEGWIFRRSGIRERRFATSSQALTDIAYQAADMALQQADIARSHVALTLLATSTPDHLLPPSAPLLAYKLGLETSGGIDLAGACAGFIYALTLADGFVRTMGKPVLVVAANILSRRIEPDDVNTAILFADAAGAVVLGPSHNAETGLLAADLIADGSGYDLIKIPGGGSRQPFTTEMASRETKMQMNDGKKVFLEAVRMMTQTSRRSLEQAHLNAADVDYWCPHQANSRLIDSVRQHLDIAPERTLSSLEDYGNSSAATIPLTLSLAAERRLFQSGQTLLMSAVGAGFVGGSLIWRL